MGAGVSHGRDGLARQADTAAGGPAAGAAGATVEAGATVSATHVDPAVLDMVREKAKREKISCLLLESTMTDHVIFPAPGQAVFFEFCVTNTSKTDETVVIDFHDPELAVVTSTQVRPGVIQVCRCRRGGGFSIVGDVGVAGLQGAFPVAVGGGGQHDSAQGRRKRHFPQVRWCLMRVALWRARGLTPHVASHGRAGEELAVPFKFQSFAAQGAARLIKLSFLDKTRRPVAILNLTVRPQPLLVDQTFRFWCAENQFMKKTIRLPARKQAPGSPGGLFVRCTNPDVICESRGAGASEPQVSACMHATRCAWFTRHCTPGRAAQVCLRADARGV